MSFSKEAVDKAIAEMLKPREIEPEYYLVDPDWYNGILKGTEVCPYHADYRHKKS